MRVVSENSDKDIARERARQDIEWPLRELAANLIRVVRGAGRAWLLPEQMARVMKRVEAYRDATGAYPANHELAAILNLASHRSEWIDDTTAGEDKIVQGALQIAASQLLGQLSQQSAGDGEMHEGLRVLLEARRRPDGHVARKRT